MRILLLAGEESGVLYAEGIRAAVLARRPDAEIRFAGTAAGIGVFVCAEQRIYTKGNSYFESNLCLSEAGCLAGLNGRIFTVDEVDFVGAYFPDYRLTGKEGGHAG